MNKLACAATLNVMLAAFVHAPEYMLAALATPAAAAAAAALVLPADRLRRIARAGKDTARRPRRPAMRRSSRHWTARRAPGRREPAAAVIS